MSLTIAERLINFNKELLPDMVQLKYEAMAENPFRYYRGTCHLFYEDLSSVTDMPDSPLAWICGDLHLENFGSYAADNNMVYFDLNDFDESILAPAIWEIVRMITSIFIGFESLNIEGEKAHKMAQLFLKKYSTALYKNKAYSIDPRTAKGIVCNFLTKAAHSKDDVVIRKRTEGKRNKLTLSLEDEHHFKLNKALKKLLKQHISEWVSTSSHSPYNYKVKSAVFRLAGTGSIGVKRYLFLLRSINQKHKYLLVDMKQSRPSSLSPYITANQPDWKDQSDRIVSSQHRMQYMSSSMLSESVFQNEAFVIQELQPVKDSFKFKLLNEKYRDMYQVISDMAELTASAQIRSSGMEGSATADDLKHFGGRTDWQERVLNYAISYTAKIKQDYREFKRAFKHGDLKQKSH